MQFPFFKTQEKKKNFFLSLLIKPDKVGAILFEEINSKLFILSTNEISVSDTSGLSADDLLNASDKVISTVEAKLPEGAEVEKTIFSVPSYWVSEGKIKQEHLEKLKKVCNDLGLIPIGYIVSIEAIVASLQKSEGAPVSGIFIEVTSDKILSYVVRGGKIIEDQQAEIQGSIIKTAEKLLASFKSVDVLPSKIILLDHKDASLVQQEFLSHQWPKDIPFLHIPQVMILERGFENEAIINGVATQMELEVLRDISMRKTSEEEEILEEKLEQVDASVLGFAKEGSPPPFAGTKAKSTPDISYFKEESEYHHEDDDKTTKPNPSPVFSFFQRLRLPSIKNILIGQNILGPLKIKLILGFIAVIVFALFVSFVYYNFILRAEIKIMSDKKSIDRSQNIAFTQNSTEGTNINIEYVEETISGEERKNSTGKKETGDKAKGEVTLYNKTDQRKTFPRGTIIVGPNNLEFELTEDVNIASTSPFSTTLSSAKGKVTASTFGREHNLPSNTNFTVKGFSSAQFIGKNTDSIIGGTRKETTVVSGEDLDQLLLEVTKKLEKEAISRIRGKLSSEEDILPSALSSRVIEKRYTEKEGALAGSVGINAKIRYTFGKYKKRDVNTVVANLAKPDVPGTYILKTSDSRIEITNVKVGKDRSAQAILKVNAVYTPQIEADKLAKTLRGKSKAQAEQQLRNIAGVTNIIITFKNNLPFMPLILPQNENNILIEEEY
jgi:hypothetical protein